MMQQQQMEDDQRWLEQEESFMVTIIHTHANHRNIHSYTSKWFVWGLLPYYEKTGASQGTFGGFQSVSRSWDCDESERCLLCLSFCF